MNKFECFEDTSKFIEDFINDDEGYFLKFMFSTLQKDMNFIMILSERIKIEKIEKLVTSLSLSHWLDLKKFHRVIAFNQTAWLKPYIDMNTKLRQKAKKKKKKRKSFSGWWIMQFLEKL